MPSDGHLRLKRHYSLIAHGPDEVELRHGAWNASSVTLKDDARSGRLFRVISRLDGSLSPREVAAAEGVPSSEVEDLLDHLVALGVVESRPATALEHFLQESFPWHAAAERPEQRPVLVVGDDGPAAVVRANVEHALGPSSVQHVSDDDQALRSLTGDTSWLADGLAFQNQLPAFEPWRGSVLVHASRTVDPPTLRALNRVCLELDMPWLHAVVDGPFLFVGPLIVPHRTACYECLELRVMMNLRESGSYLRYARAMVDRRVRVGESPVQPSLTTLLGSLAAIEILNFVVTGSSFTLGRMLSLYLPTMEFAYHDVLRAPTCPACAPSPVRDDSELYFEMGALLGSAAPHSGNGSSSLPDR